MINDTTAHQSDPRTGSPNSGYDTDQAAPDPAGHYLKLALELHLDAMLLLVGAHGDLPPDDSSGAPHTIDQSTTMQWLHTDLDNLLQLTRTCQCLGARHRSGVATTQLREQLLARHEKLAGLLELADAAPAADPERRSTPLEGICAVRETIQQRRQHLLREPDPPAQPSLDPEAGRPGKWLG